MTTIWAFLYKKNPTKYTNTVCLDIEHSLLVWEVLGSFPYGFNPLTFKIDT